MFRQFIKNRMESAKLRAKMAIGKLWMILGVVVVYEAFVLSIVSGFVTPFLGGFTSGYGIVGTLILSAVSQLPLAYVLDKYVH